MLPNFTGRQWATLAIIGFADFGNALCVSLQAPFFPLEAEKKGCTATEYGLVFGIFELIVFLVSPLYGKYLHQIGPRVLFNRGIFTTGAAAIVFGLLDRVQGHTMFITLAFAVRIIEALGNAAFLTASFAIIAREFPNHISTTYALMETFFGLGWIAGPMFGGILYSFDGYYLPFVSLGLLLFVIGFLTMCILTKNAESCPPNQTAVKILSIMRIPGLMVNSLSVITSSISIGFLSATLEPHLRQFQLSPIYLGSVFIINGVVYSVTAPFWGWMVDKCLNPKISALIGSCLVACGFCLIGPTSFLPIESRLSTIMIGLVLHGLGIASILVASFSDALRTAIKRGFPDSIETYGLISGLWTSVSALGGFIGPSVSGALFDSVGFRKATIFVIGCHVFVAFVLVIMLALERSSQPYKELSSTESLIKTHDGLFHNDKNRCEQNSLLAHTPHYGSTIDVNYQRVGVPSSHEKETEA